MSKCDSFTFTNQPPATDWINLGTLNWVTGQTINGHVEDLIENPVAGTVYELFTGGFPDNVTFFSSGVYSGLIAAEQGDTYSPVFKGTTPTGEVSYSTLTVLLVGLEIVAPTFTGLADLGSVQKGASISVPCADAVSDDGNPAGTEVLVYSIDVTSDSIIGATINSSTGVYAVPAVDASEVEELKTVVIRVTNSADEYATDDFTFTIIASATTAPTVTGFSSGNPGCVAVVKATWANGAEFNVELNETGVSIDMAPLIAYAGGGTLSNWQIDSGAAPTGLTLGLSTGLLTGNQGDIAGDYTFTMTVDNSAGTSLSSPTITITVYSEAGTTPTVVSIDIVDGSSELFVNYSESITAIADTTYLLGVSCTLNNIAVTNLTYVSGAGTARHKYTITEVAVANNTFKWSYDKDIAGSDLTGDTSGLEVADATDVTFVVATPPTGELIFDADFENGILEENTGIGSWGSSNTSLGCTHGVTSERAKTGTYSLKFTYPNAGTNRRDFNLGGRHHELWVNYDIFIPTNYDVYDQAGSSDNNKQIKFWNSPEQYPERGGLYIGPNWEPTGTVHGVSKNRLFVSSKIGTTNTDVDPANGEYPTSLDNGDYGDSVRLTDHGKWMNITLHVKNATIANDDGVFEEWIIDWEGNVRKIHEILNGVFYGTDGETNDPQKGFDKGYLFSTHNFNYEATTVYFLDNFKIATTNVFNNFVEGS